MSVTVSGGAAAFVTPSPTSAASVAAGTPVSVNLAVSVPAGTALGNYTGTVQVVANKKALAELDEPTRQALLKAAAEAETRGWKISREKNDWYANELKKHGMQVLPPSDKMKAEFKKVGDAMVDEWLKKTGAQGKAILDAYEKM